MNKVKIMVLKGICVSPFLMFLTIIPCFANDPPPNKNTSSILSYSITFFYILPDLKSDISIYVSLLDKNKEIAEKTRSVTIALFKHIRMEGYIPIQGVVDNPYSKKIDIAITEMKDGVLVTINTFRMDGKLVEKLFVDEDEEDIALDISCQLFGRGA